MHQFIPILVVKQVKIILNFTVKLLMNVINNHFWLNQTKTGAIDSEINNF